MGAIGSGIGGGVELTLRNMTQILCQRGHQVTVLAPQGSTLPGISLIEVAGQPQPSIQVQDRQTPVVLPGQSLLANLWETARCAQADYDLIINVAYDWLPFYLTEFFTTPVAHLVSMGSLNDAMDQIIAQVAHRHAHRICVYTQTQANTFPGNPAFFPIGFGLDLSRYDFCATPDPQLCWMGRISPEKALEDAVATAHRCGLPLQVMGKIQDQSYFEKVLAAYPQAQVHYRGFKSTQAMQQILRRAQALLVTPRWIEAFGIVLIEALACGVPVIAYRRGGPAEIVQSGTTGWLVDPDNVNQLVEAVGKIPQIQRQACRRQAEEQFSLEALGDRLEAWFQAILTSR